MTEAVLNNMIQDQSRQKSQLKNLKPAQKTKASFAKTMKQTQQKKVESKKTIKIKRDQTSDSDQDFISKLKELLAKNNKELPEELLSLLNGGSLSKQQEAVLSQLILKLQNSKINISELKSILRKNSQGDSQQMNKLFSGLKDKSEVESLNFDNLEELSASLEADDLQLEELVSDLKNELDKIAQTLSDNSKALKIGTEKNLENILKSDGLAKKAEELSSILENHQIDSDLLEKLNDNLPGTDLAKLADKLTEIGDNLSFKPELLAAESALTEISTKLKNLSLRQEVDNNILPDKAGDSILNSKLFAEGDNNSLLMNLSNNSNLGEKDSFFDLNKQDSFLNFNFSNQLDTANSNEVEFNLNSNSSNVAQQADVKSQVVEEFKGNYSPETKEMQIQLKPDSLGKIDLSLSYDNDKLVGKMLVESEVVRSQLESSLKGLKSDLLKQGVNIEQFKIETAKNSPQQVEKQNDFAFNDQNSAFSDGETGQNQEYEQREFFRGQYYVQKNKVSNNLSADNLIMRQQEIINRAAFSDDKIDLLA